MEKRTLTVRGLTLGDGAPKICVPVTARTMEEAGKQVAGIAAAPCDLVELRADYFDGDPIEELCALRDALPNRPVLFTLRTRREGGERAVSLEEYADLNRRAAKSGAADLIDLEWNRGADFVRDLCGELQRSRVKVVVSFHDFHGTPEKEGIVGLLRQMQALGADVTKAAVMPSSARDVLTLLDAAVAMREQYADRPYIVMSMGRLGGISRLCGALIGSAVTFASVGDGSAPGQMDAAFVAEALDMLKI